MRGKEGGEVLGIRRGEEGQGLGLQLCRQYQPCPQYQVCPCAPISLFPSTSSGCMILWTASHSSAPARGGGRGAGGRGRLRQGPAGLLPREQCACTEDNTEGEAGGGYESFWHRGKSEGDKGFANNIRICLLPQSLCAASKTPQKLMVCPWPARSGNVTDKWLSGTPPPCESIPPPCRKLEARLGQPFWSRQTTSLMQICRNKLVPAARPVLPPPLSHSPSPLAPPSHPSLPR